MAELTQEQIDALIQEINDAEAPESVTNEMVATVLNHLNKQFKAGNLSLGDLVATISTIQASINSLQAALSGVSDELQSIDGAKADKNNHTGRLTHLQAPTVVLASMGKELDSAGKTHQVMHDAKIGDYIWDKITGNIEYYKSADDIKQLGPPERGLVYTNAHSNRQYRWTGAAWQPVAGNGNDGTINQSVYQNMEVLNGNITALSNALANIAFTGERPEMTQLDWSGLKALVTINNTLTGCSADKSGIQQVLIGRNLVVTITADEGKLIRSVNVNNGTCVIANNKATATITIENVQDDVTLEITANATAKGIFSASISDSRVSGTGAASGIVEGSAWSSELTINETAEEGAIITSVIVSMAGGGNISVNANNVVSTDFVTGNITIEAVVRVVGFHEVSLEGDNATINVIRVEEDTTLDCKVSPDEGYRITEVPIVTMGGVVVDGAATPNRDENDEPDGTYQVVVPNVNADIVISVSTINIWFEEHNVVGWVKGRLSESAFLTEDKDALGYIVSPIFDLPKVGNYYPFTIEKVIAEDWGTSNNNQVQIWRYNEGSVVKSTTISIGRKTDHLFSNTSNSYPRIRICFKISSLDGCYFASGSQGSTNYLWKGKDISGGTIVGSSTITENIT